MRFGVKTDKGRVRELNEDNYNMIAGYSGVPVSFIVADGMGGHNSGEIASKVAVDYVSNCILELTGMFSEKEDLSGIIRDIVEKANTAVYSLAKEQESTHGMGTTLILAMAFNKKLYIGHVGDSRAYIYRGENLIRITTDHSYIEELIQAGTLSIEEAENHPNKNIITRALGGAETIEVDTLVCNIKENDVFILCTDGLTNMVSEKEIKDIIESVDDPELACIRLVDLANEKGGEDNITVIMFKNE